MVGVGESDCVLAARIAEGDAAELRALIARHHGAMIRFAAGWVGSRAIAEEVVQESWLDVVQGIGQFEGRASLKSWIFRIVVRTAIARAKKEGRSIPFSALEAEEGPTVGPDRFLPNAHRWAGHWAAPPQSWEQVPEERLVAAETNRAIERAIETLPASQRQVITLRDIEGWSSAEVCTLLELSEPNQRVLLHRARAKVRLAVAEHLGLVP